MTTLRLFISESDLPLSASSVLAWATHGGAAQQRGISALDKLPAATRVEVFLPPARILRTSVALPKGSGRQASKLLPFALDQVLLAEPTEQHLAYRTAGDVCHVAAIEHDMFAELLNTLTLQGCRPRAAWATDELLIPSSTNLLWCGNGWARRIDDTAQWFDASSPSQPPALLVATLGKVDELSLIIDPAVAATIDLDAWQTALATTVIVSGDDPFNQSVRADAIDLMQGEFAAGTQIDVDWAKLKPTGLLVAAALSVFTLVWFGQWLSWRSEERAIREEMNRAFTQAFPGTPIVDAQLQLQAKLKNGAAKPATNIGALGPLLQAAPQLASTNAQLVSVNYADGHLQAEYQAKPEQLAPLVTALGQSGKVETSASKPDRTLITYTPRT